MVLAALGTSAHLSDLGCGSQKALESPAKALGYALLSLPSQMPQHPSAAIVNMRASLISHTHTPTHTHTQVCLVHVPLARHYSFLKPDRQGCLPRSLPLPLVCSRGISAASVIASSLELLLCMEIGHLGRSRNSVASEWVGWDPPLRSEEAPHCGLATCLGRPCERLSQGRREGTRSCFSRQHLQTCAAVSETRPSASDPGCPPSHMK